MARRAGQPTPQRARPAAAADALSPLIEFVLRQNGLNPSGYQPRALNRRLPACLRSLRARSESAALAALSRNPALGTVALSALLIGVSGFFRDPPVFEHLRQATFPEALKAGGELRVCSVGCSAGQELYSVAMLLDELGGLENSILMGTDCRSQAIDQARAGWFDASELAGIGPERLARYFQKEDNGALVSPALRKRTHWHVADLHDWPDTEPWDVILFRNVAIYLEPEQAHAAWRRLGRGLKPGGFLVTGKAGRPPSTMALRRESGCIYRKFSHETHGPRALSIS
jgi:chemotaxis protein methyltransferase CheR